jgi:MFS family permease
VGQGAIASSTRVGGRVLFAAVAFGTTALVAGITVAPLVGEDIGGSASLSGLPWAASVLGTGIGSMLISQLMARRGRGPGLIAGYVAGTVGAALAVVAMRSDGYLLFVAALLLLGSANSSNNLARYVAADIYPPERRASGIGMVVWAGTVGGVVGPALIAPTGRAAVGAGLPRLSGPYVVALIGCAIAFVSIGILLARRPHALRAQDAETLPSTGVRVLEMWRVPRAQAALVSLAVAQTVMVLIMAMTPLHMRSSGHGLSAVGWVISAHVFGMYGLSPVSGRLTDRFGSVRMILSGFGVLAFASILAAASPHDAGLLLAIPLFLLGFGWSLAFVAASALLAGGLSYADRARLQGATDLVVWTAAAIAGGFSGVLADSAGYGLLCVIGAGLIALPVATVIGRRRALAVQPA